MRYILYIIAILSVVGCSEPELIKNRLTGPAFGTTYNITYFSTEELVPESGIDSVINAVNRSVSTYQPDSDISKINSGDSTIVIDRIFKDVYELSERVFILSEGYFDPTIGVLRNAYGFGTDKPLSNLNQAVIDSLRNYVGFEKVNLTSDLQISKEHPEIYFDFNAVAKGYGIDELGSYLESLGIENFLIELGGEVLTKGSNLESEKPWAIGIETIDSEVFDKQIEVVVKLSDMAMASSGNYRKFRIDSITGKKYVHTINPLTGLAEESDVTSATVFAATCAEADAYATAFMAMGLDRSKNLLEELTEIDAYLTYEKDGSTGSYATPGFELLRKD